MLLFYSPTISVVDVVCVVLYFCECRSYKLARLCCYNSFHLFLAKWMEDLCVNRKNRCNRNSKKT